MDAIFNLDTLGTLFQYIAAAFAASLLALWLSLVFWVYRDAGARLQDRLARILAALVTALLGPMGLAIYLVLRPARSLAAIYQQTLEEESLLSEIEERAVCPGCGLRTQADWQVCPQCHTRLRKACASCGKLMELGWKLCPYCATSIPGMREEELLDPAPLASDPPV